MTEQIEHSRSRSVRRVAALGCAAGQSSKSVDIKSRQPGEFQKQLLCSANTSRQGAIAFPVISPCAARKLSLEYQLRTVCPCVSPPGSLAVLETAAKTHHPLPLPVAILWQALLTSTDHYQQPSLPDFPPCFTYLNW